MYFAYHMAYCMLQHIVVNPRQGQELKYLAATSMQDSVKFLAKQSANIIAVGIRLRVSRNQAGCCWQETC